MSYQDECHCVYMYTHGCIGPEKINCLSPEHQLASYLASYMSVWLFESNENCTLYLGSSIDIFCCVVASYIL